MLWHTALARCCWPINHKRVERLYHEEGLHCVCVTARSVPASCEWSSVQAPINAEGMPESANLVQVRAVIEPWRQDYNYVRPYSVL
ncbi:hypothetical protein DB032_19440 [Chromobacterium sp. Panama]|nr:hypothetical protein DB032_19440 [Chromobacterium sp. Panama]